MLPDVVESKGAGEPVLGPVRWANITVDVLRRTMRPKSSLSGLEFMFPLLEGVKCGKVVGNRTTCNVFPGTIQNPRGSVNDGAPTPFLSGACPE